MHRTTRPKKFLISVTILTTIKKLRMMKNSRIVKLIREEEKKKEIKSIKKRKRLSLVKE